MLARPAGQRREAIEEGDLVIVYESHDRMKAVTVQSGQELNNRYGVFRHADWIGKPFGCKVTGKSGGFVHLLAPSPELWTCVLSHRTQILYIADISFIISYLELRPGCIVAESGTGSGSLTTSLARSVAPSGHVFTFDFHGQRADSARQDFIKNGLDGIVTVEVRDIQGLGFPDKLNGKVDAVFLDLPQPWLAIPSAVNALRSNGALCSFSPCIEQVQRSCETLQKYKFTEIRTFEVLMRRYEVREELLKLLQSEETNNGTWEPIKELFSSPPHKKLCSGMMKDVHSVANECTGSVLDTRDKDMSSRVPGLLMAKPLLETRGHTGYLTFALSYIG
ncbi:hypothetical protein KP509_12G018300 [Ceratopteris richardii]|uniref:tRNA (adenine(58)-N(1))-methyltransferase n=1 Tax=Ceratopteris richardii TaxID=49495 RepID=A0A8T2TJF1_CERRI|nr:hypothetical protein KP509_12G018300 [Ceratopteris richardii]